MPEWNLGITEEQFDDIYGGLNIDKEIFKRSPETDLDYIENFAGSKLWRMNNWYHIVDKEGNKLWFVMNLAQHKAYARQLRHPRSIILKSRQRGISTFFLINYFDDAVTLDNITVGMQSYGLLESTALLEKLTVAWEMLSDENKALCQIELVKNNTKAMGFTNGSEIKVATSFRGTTLQRLHVSELGKIANKDPKKAKELKSGTLQAVAQGNQVAIESTAEGQHNAFHEWWYTAVDHVGDRSLKDFDPVFLSWVDDPDCVSLVEQRITEEDQQELDVIEEEWADYSSNPEFKLSEAQKWWFVAARRELGDDFYQEYPHTPEAAFNAVRDGTYYARLWRNEGNVYDSGSHPSGRARLYDPMLPVHVVFDLGVNDMMVMGFIQVMGREIRIIDEYHSHGEGLEHYVGVMKTKEKQLGYAYGTTVLPHDGNVFEMGASMTRKARLRELGVRKIKVLKRTKDVNTDIEQVRRAIPDMWIDPITCAYILKMMQRYSKKWDDVLGVFKNQPLHDEWSNPADMVRYAVMARLHSGNTAEKDMVERDKGNFGGRRGKLKSNVVGGIAL